MGKGRPTAAIALVAAMLTAVAVPTAGAAAPAKKHKIPKDVCSVLTDEQVAALIPAATPVSRDESGGRSCLWSDTGALAGLTVSVLQNPGLDKLALKTDAQSAGGKIIKHLGSYATQTSVDTLNTEVRVLLGKLIVEVAFATSERDVTDGEKAGTLAIAKAAVKKI